MTLWQSWRVVPPRFRPWVTGVRPTSGRDHLGARGPIFCAMGEDRPHNACMFGGQRNGGHVHVSPLLQPFRPGALGIRLFVDDAQIRSRTVYEERSQVPIASARDLPEPLFAAARVLPRCDAERGGEAASILEDVRITDTGD